MRIIEISINANLFPVKYLKNRVITIFNFEVCSPPGPSFPLIYVVSIYHMSIQYKGFAGSRGGTYFDIENGDDPNFLIFDRKQVCIKTCFFDAHVQ